MTLGKRSEFKLKNNVMNETRTEDYSQLSKERHRLVSMDSSLILRSRLLIFLRNVSDEKGEKLSQSIF